MNKSTTALLAVLIIAIVANLIVVNYTVFRLLPAKLEAISSKKIVQDEIKVEKNEDSCGIGCQQALQFALKQVDQKIATLSMRISTQSAVQIAQKPIATAPTSKESFIPMGTGTTTKKDWEDVAGSDVYINTSSYQGMKEVYFEVSMHIPTKNGTLYARLYNVTDKHPVWYSDVKTDQDTSTFVSSKISLDPGNKQYRIQLMTSLEYLSVLDTARIKIISN